MKCPLQYLWILVQYRDANQASAACLCGSAAHILPNLLPACWCRVACMYKGKARRGGKGALFPAPCQKYDLVLTCWLLRGRCALNSSLTWPLLLERKGQITAPGPEEVKMGLKVQAEVCSSGVFTLANNLVENHLRKQNCPT